MNYFTSDLHFGHRNVINYCNRPYADLEEMHLAIISVWNNTVTLDDTVYVLGDFSLNPKWVELMLPQMNGTKILIPGNHDSCFAFKNRKVEKQVQRYLNAGFKEIHQTLELTLKNGTKVLMSHLPYASKEGNEYDQRYIEYKPIDSGLYLLAGHLHGRYQKFGRMIDVGFDVQLKLFSEDEIIELINDTRDFIPSRITEHYKERDKNEKNKDNEY